MEEISKSVFDPDFQTQNLSSKIVVALERIAEAFKVGLWDESKKYQLSPIQIQILIFLRFHSPEKCKVSYLAKEFNITKATVSDAVKVLLAKELIYKQIEPEDTRSYQLFLSESGKKIAQASAFFSGNFEKAISQIPDNDQFNLFNQLYTLIAKLNQAGVVSVQRMCFNCQFYQANQGTHFCQFLQQSLKTDDLRVDCPEHQAV
jgi:DNA-binding MarR family transcriptional regulator